MTAPSLCAFVPSLVCKLERTRRRSVGVCRSDDAVKESSGREHLQQEIRFPADSGPQFPSVSESELKARKLLRLSMGREKRKKREKKNTKKE